VVFAPQTVAEPASNCRCRHTAGTCIKGQTGTGQSEHRRAKGKRTGSGSKVVVRMLEWRLLDLE
jgi:hypothetical protein